MNALILKMALPIVVNIIEGMMTRENLTKYGGKLFNLIEEYVIDSETEIDDAIVLPLVQAARMALGITGSLDE